MSSFLFPGSFRHCYETTSTWFVSLVFVLEAIIIVPSLGRLRRYLSGVIVYGKLQRPLFGPFFIILELLSELAKVHFCPNVFNVAHPYVSAKLSTKLSNCESKSELKQFQVCFEETLFI